MDKQNYLTKGAHVYPDFQVNAVSLLSNYINKIEDWLYLDLNKLALFGILIHPQTTTHRIARTFNAFLISVTEGSALESPPRVPGQKFSNRVPLALARQMLERNKPIPELDALTDNERKNVNKILLREHEAMIRALDSGKSYEDSYIQLNPGAAVFASPLIWVKVNNMVNYYTYDELIEALQEGRKELEKYKDCYTIDLKLYQEYLKQMERFK